MTTPVVRERKPTNAIKPPKFPTCGSASGGCVDQIQRVSDLPHDLITHDILTRLPIKSLMRFKAVSKHWYSTLSSSEFAHLYFNLSPFSQPFSPLQFIFIFSAETYYLLLYDDDISTSNTNNTTLVEVQVDFGELKGEFSLVGSCNGLLCLGSYKGEFVIIWNPITNRWKKFSDPYVLTLDICCACWGFGYVSSVDDYKVVRVLEMSKNSEMQVHVFSLRTNTWTRIDSGFLHIAAISREMWFAEFDGEFVYEIRPCPFGFFTDNAVLVNETLYWMMNVEYGNSIIAFDLVLETVYIVPHVTVRFYIEVLCVLGGVLSLFSVDIFNNYDASVKLLKGPGQIEVINLYRHKELQSCRNLVGFTRRGNFLIQLGDSELGLIDPNSSSSKYTLLFFFQKSLKNMKITSYVPSLFSPLMRAESQKG